MNKMINKAKDVGIPLEIYNKSYRAIDLEIQNGEIITYTKSDHNSYNLKSIIDKKSVVISTQELNDKLFDELKDNASLLGVVRENEFSSTSLIGDKIKYESDLIDIRYIKDLSNKYLNDEVEKIIIYISSNLGDKTIINTNDISLIDNNKYVTVVIEVATRINGKNNTKKISYTDINFNVDKVEDELLICIDKALKSCKSKKISSRNSKLILNNSVVKSFFNIICNSFYAEPINMNKSIFSDDFNKMIASDKLSIIEDPLNGELPGRCSFDKEGSLTTYKKIIDKGIFSTKLYNKIEANKDGVVSTGNASGLHNAMIMPGDKTFLELVSIMGNGVIIDEVLGLHNGINTLTGDISVPATGYIVENGVIGDAISGFIINTNYKELMNNIIEVGNDFRTFSTSWSGVSLLLDNINITGSEE